MGPPRRPGRVEYGPSHTGANKHHEHRIRVVQRREHASLIAWPSLVVGHDHDGVPRLPPLLARHVGCSVHQCSVDVRSAIEPLAAHHIVELSLHLADVFLEPQAQASLRVEHHDAHAVLIPQNRQRSMRGVRHPLHMHPHAAADVQQQQHIHRQAFKANFADRDGFPILPKHKIFLNQIGDGALSAVEDQRVDPAYGDVTMKDGSASIIRGPDATSRGQQWKPDPKPHVASSPEQFDRQLSAYLCRRHPCCKFSGAVLQPLRPGSTLTWIVERSFAWLGRNRRFSKDYEYRVQTSETLLDIATIRLLNRLVPA